MQGNTRKFAKKPHGVQGVEGSNPFTGITPLFAGIAGDQHRPHLLII